MKKAKYQNLRFDFFTKYFPVIFFKNTMEKRDEIDDFETKHKFKSKGKQAQDPCSCTKV